jgi:hypothetical protein
LYYSSFWSIPSVPDEFYLYQFESAEEAQSIYSSYVDFPIAKVTNVLISFTDTIPLTYKNGENTHTTKLKERFTLNTRAVIEGTLTNNNSFPTNRDSANHLKSLLTRVFHILMKQRKMYWYGLADKSQAYYQTPASLPKGYSKFEYPFRKVPTSKRKSIYGKYLDMGFWHYGVSCKPIFDPFLCFSLKSHIVFTTDGFNAWQDKVKMHSHRRTKGKRFFNAEWRDLELSFLNSLCDTDGEIKIALNKSFILHMPLFPEMYWTDFGYFEPKTNERFDILSSFEEEVDYSDRQES